MSKKRHVSKLKTTCRQLEGKEGFSLYVRAKGLCELVLVSSLLVGYFPTSSSVYAPAPAPAEVESVCSLVDS